MGIISPLSNQDDSISKYRKLIREQVQIILEKDADKLNEDNEIAKFTKLIESFGTVLSQSNVGIEIVSSGVESFDRIYKNTRVFKHPTLIKEDTYVFYILLGIAMSDKDISDFKTHRDYKVENLEAILEKLEAVESLY